MKKIAVLALIVLAALTPAVQAQTAAGFTAKWEGTYTLKSPDGTPAAPRPIVFNLTQKAKELTGTAGPADQQTKLEKGLINAGKATFEVPLPNGTTFKFALTIVKGHLTGDMTGVGPDGSVRGQAKVDAAKVTAGAKK